MHRPHRQTCLLNVIHQKPCPLGGTFRVLIDHIVHGDFNVIQATCLVLLHGLKAEAGPAAHGFTDGRDLC